MPHEIISASRNLELYDEELGREIYKIGIHSLDEVTDISLEELYKVSQQIIQAGKFQVTLMGGDPAFTSPLVKAQLEKWPSMKVLQIDTRAMHQIDEDPEWFVKVVDELPEHVYVTIGVDGMNPDELTWCDLMNLIRELTYRRNVVGLDLVGRSLQQGQAFYCAKLLYKILGYVFNR